DVVADQEQVARLDVEVLQAVADVHQVECFGRLGQVGQQFAARDAGSAAGLVLLQEVVQAPVRQLHHEDQFAGEEPDEGQRQEERGAAGLDVLDCLPFLVGGGLAGEAAGRAVDELDRLEKAAGRLTLPHVPEAAAAERYEQAVAGDRFAAGRLGG